MEKVKYITFDLATQKLRPQYEFLKSILEIYNKLPEDEKESNLLYLKIATKHLIIIVKHILLIAGEYLDIEIKPEDPIGKRLEKINEFDPSLIESHSDFLQKIERVRQTVEHNDLKIVRIDNLEKLVNYLEEFIKDFNNKANERMINEMLVIKEGTFLLEKVKKLLIVPNIKDIYPGDFLPVMKDNIEYILEGFKNRSNSDILGGLKHIKTQSEELKKKIYPFTVEFIHFIGTNYSKNDLEDNGKIISIFQAYLDKFYKCPVCGNEECWEEPDFFKCVCYSSKSKIISSLAPVTIVEGKGHSALVSSSFCEISEDGDCKYCHAAGMVNEDDPVPKHSLFCEDCGFYLFPGEETGIIEDFTS
ncbi:MAG: hypothetical protein ACTSUE_17790 [Promethearchaeota archaeon]